MFFSNLFARLQQHKTISIYDVTAENHIGFNIREIDDPHIIRLLTKQTLKEISLNAWIRVHILYISLFPYSIYRFLLAFA